MLLLKPFTEDHGRSGVQPLSLSLRTMVWHHNTRTHVISLRRLLGPCLKTGQSKRFRQHQGDCGNTRADAPRAAGQPYGSTIVFGCPPGFAGDTVRRRHTLGVGPREASCSVITNDLHGLHITLHTFDMARSGVDRVPAQLNPSTAYRISATVLIRY